MRSKSKRSKSTLGALLNPSKSGRSRSRGSSSFRDWTSRMSQSGRSRSCSSRPRSFKNRSGMPSAFTQSSMVSGFPYSTGCQSYMPSGSGYSRSGSMMSGSDYSRSGSMMSGSMMSGSMMPRGNSMMCDDFDDYDDPPGISGGCCGAIIFGALLLIGGLVFGGLVLGGVIDLGSGSDSEDSDGGAADTNNDNPISKETSQLKEGTSCEIEGVKVKVVKVDGIKVLRPKKGQKVTSKAAMEITQRAPNKHAQIKELKGLKRKSKYCGICDACGWEGSEAEHPGHKPGCTGKFRDQVHTANATDKKGIASGTGRMQFCDKCRRMLEAGPFEEGKFKKSPFAQKLRWRVKKMKNASVARGRCSICTWDTKDDAYNEQRGMDDDTRLKAVRELAGDRADIYADCWKNPDKHRTQKGTGKKFRPDNPKKKRRRKAPQ